jgi:hypothetical protein
VGGIYFLAGPPDLISRFRRLAHGAAGTEFVAAAGAEDFFAHGVGLGPSALGTDEFGLKVHGWSEIGPQRRNRASGQRLTYRWTLEPSGFPSCG